MSSLKKAIINRLDATLDLYQDAVALMSTPENLQFLMLGALEAIAGDFVSKVEYPLEAYTRPLGIMALTLGLKLCAIEYLEHKDSKTMLKLGTTQLIQAAHLEMERSHSDSGITSNYKLQVITYFPETNSASISFSATLEKEYIDRFRDILTQFIDTLDKTDKANPTLSVTETTSGAEFTLTLSTKDIQTFTHWAKCFHKVEADQKQMRLNDAKEEAERIRKAQQEREQRKKEAQLELEHKQKADKEKQTQDADIKQQQLEISLSVASRVIAPKPTSNFRLQKIELIESTEKMLQEFNQNPTCQKLFKSEGVEEDKLAALTLLLKKLRRTENKESFQAVEQRIKLELRTIQLMVNAEQPKKHKKETKPRSIAGSSTTAGSPPASPTYDAQSTGVGAPPVDLDLKDDQPPAAATAEPDSAPPPSTPGVTEPEPTRSGPTPFRRAPGPQKSPKSSGWTPFYD